MATIGRPKKEFDPEQFEKLLALQCTEKEIAGFFHMAIPTLIERIKEHYDGASFFNVREVYGEQGKVSLRAHQFELSKKYPQMAVWLGKQQLGQREPKTEIDLKSDNTHRHDGPPSVVFRAVSPTGAETEVARIDPKPEPELKPKEDAPAGTS